METFKKIIIKSEADLPKEDMWYVAFSKVINDFVHAHPTKSNWKDIEWYFQPFPEPVTDNLALQSDEEDSSDAHWALYGG